MAKLADAAIIVAMTKGIGFTPSTLAEVSANGNTNTAAALLVINCVSTEVTVYTSASVNQGLPAPRPTIAEAVASGRSALIEVRTDRVEQATLRRDLARAVAEAVDDAV